MKGFVKVTLVEGGELIPTLINIDKIVSVSDFEVGLTETAIYSESESFHVKESYEVIRRRIESAQK